MTSLKRDFSEFSNPDLYDLEFGIELEFTIDDDRARITNDGHPGEAQAHHLAQALHRNAHTQQLSIAFECQSCVWNDDSTVQLCVFCQPLGNAAKIGRYTIAFPSANLPAQIEGDGYRARLCHFIVKPEMSLVQMQDHQKTPLELATPKQRVRGALRSDFPEIRTMINGLGDLKWGIQFETMMGMHIHIGQVQSMNVAFAKRVISIVAILEDRLLRGSLLTADRKQSHDNASIVRHSSFMTRNIAPSGVRWDLRRSTKHVTKEMKDFLAWPRGKPPAFYHNDYANDQLHMFLTMVWRATSLPQLAEGLMGHTRNCGLRMHLRNTNDNYNQTRYSGGTNSSTFEFRYPAATMDPRLIGLWVELCSEIVRVAWEPSGVREGRMQDMYQIIDDARGQPAWSTQERDGLLKLLKQGNKIRLWNQLLGQLAANRDDSRDFYTRELIPQAGMLRM